MRTRARDTTRLFALSLALLLGAGALAGLYLEHRLQDLLETQIVEELEQHTRIAELILATAGGDEIDRWADELGARCECRMTVIAPSGAVLGDSEVALPALASLENHADRPEVRAAERGTGIARRRSSTVGVEMLYVARALPDGTVVRAARAISRVEAVVFELRVLFGIAVITGLVIALGTSTIAYALMARTMRVLSEERARTEAVLEGMSEAVLAIDADERITVINKAAVELLGIADSAIGMRVDDLGGLPALEGLVRGTASSVDFELAIDKPRQVLAHATPLPDGAGAVIVMLDVTGMRNLERMRKDFVANVSHELRTPVSVVRANAETLLAGALDDPPAARRFLDAMIRSSERLSRILDDLLDLSRIEAGKYGFDLEELDVRNAVDHASEAVERASKEKRIVLSHSVPEEVLVLADAKALDQVLVNLLDNAVKYTPEGGSVLVRGTRQGDRIRIEVEDDGPGIEPKHRERIFERFYRVDKGRSRQLGGTGLGLAIVKHLVESMDGRVGVLPAEPHGSIFYVELPATGE